MSIDWIFLLMTHLKSETINDGLIKRRLVSLSL